MEDKEIFIQVTKNGPYLVWGRPEISQKTIYADKNGVCIEYRDDKIYEAASEPYALCRCGLTKNAPFCDGSHLCSDFDGQECASFEPILNSAKKYQGPDLVLYDNEKYCAFARFCDADGSIWNLIYKGCEETNEKAVKEANLCPAGRLIIYDKNGNSKEAELNKSIAILEDGGLKISGPIWVRGRIKIQSANGECYEIRNRQTLCRCGNSKNKPFCDSTHRHINFKAVNKL